MVDTGSCLCNVYFAFGGFKAIFFLETKLVGPLDQLLADLDGRLPLDCVGKNGADSSYQLQCFGFF